MIKSNEIILKECLKDLYKLGIIQGEHNINWTDEYNLLEYSSFINRLQDVLECNVDVVTTGSNNKSFLEAISKEESEDKNREDRQEEDNEDSN